VPDENYRAILRGNDSPSCRDIIGQRYRRILNDGDIEAILPEYFVDTFPTGAVNKTTVDENNCPCFEIRIFSDDVFLS